MSSHRSSALDISQKVACRAMGDAESTSPTPWIIQIQLP
jgi:hypothetical protein